MPARTRNSVATKSSKCLLPQKQPGIAAFTRAVKPGARVTTSIKRKLQDADLDGNSISTTPESPSPPKENLSKRSKTLPSPKKPISKQAAGAVSKRCPPSFLLNVSHAPLAATSISPVPKDDDSDSSQSIERPSAFHDLANLNSAFLGALSLHFTHNGPNAPANLKQLLPSIEKIWKKRKVATPDIQRLLYIQEIARSSPNGTASHLDTTFKLTTYGGQIFLERLENSKSQSSSRTPLKEAELNANFTKNLEDYWQRSPQTYLKGKANSDLLRDIPLAPIQNTNPASSSLVGGRQKTLDQLLGSLKSKTAKSENCLEEKSTLTRDSNSATDRRNGLLERIKSKTLRQSKLPPPLSKEAMFKRAAADRIPEVVNVLLFLTPSASPVGDLDLAATPLKKSYTMDIITQNIRDSMQNPISKQEIEASLNILSQPDLAGGWVSILTTNRMQSVVLTPGKSISPSDINEKVARMKF